MMGQCKFSPHLRVSAYIVQYAVGTFVVQGVMSYARGNGWHLQVYHTHVQAASFPGNPQSIGLK